MTSDMAAEHNGRAAAISRGPALFLIAALLFVTGCAPNAIYKKVDAFIAAGQYAEADGLIEKEKKQFEGNHEILYYFDKGSILQMLGDYKNSSLNLQKAEGVIDELFTKSVTQEVSSFFTNDMNLPYEGEDFEKVMVNVMGALNYLYMGDYEGARVEVRRIDTVLNQVMERNEGKGIYKQDAFARYLSAYIYEAKGELDDAYIDYKKAYRAYEDYYTLYGTEIPEIVKQDVLRIADARGYKDDVREFKEQWGDVLFTKYKELKAKGEVLLVVYDGMAPYKVSVNKSSVVYEHEATKTNPTTVSVAFPKFVERGYVVGSVSAMADNRTFYGYEIENVAKIAVKTLEDKNLLIAAKAFARAAVKYFTSKAIQGKGENKMLNLLTNVYNVVSEQADTRSWRTLPARFILIRMPLKPGKHRIKVLITDVTGANREQTVDVKVGAGQKKAVPVFAFN